MYLAKSKELVTPLIVSPLPWALEFRESIGGALSELGWCYENTWWARLCLLWISKCKKQTGDDNIPCQWESFWFSSVVQLCWTLCNPMGCSVPGLPVHHQLLEPTQTHVHWVGDPIQPSHPLSSLLFPPSIFPSIRVFSNESVLHIRWPKYWSFSFSISPSNEYSGLISFRMDWLDLLAVQGTLKRSSPTPQFKKHQHSAFFIVQLSHPYMTSGKP